MPTLDHAHEIATRRGWLAHTPEAFRAGVLERSQLLHFAPGEMIYGVGDGPGGIYCLICGSIRVTIAPGNEGPFFAHLMGAGHWIGEGPVISGQPRLVGLSAGRASAALHLPLPALRAMIDADPLVWRYVAQLALINVQTTLIAMNDSMIRDDERRLVATLLRLGDCRLATPPGHAPASIDATQEELAIMANLARSTVGTLLRRLRAQRLLELAYGAVVIPDPDRLRGRLGA